jgi:hypothetical protein
MALYNQNYEAKLLTVADSPYTIDVLGNGITASTIHQIFCLSTGVINITAFGGGNFTWSATTNESINILIGQCNVISGEFIGFKTQHTQTQQSPYYK